MQPTEVHAHVPRWRQVQRRNSMSMYFPYLQPLPQVPTRGPIDLIALNRLSPCRRANAPEQGHPAIPTKQQTRPSGRPRGGGKHGEKEVARHAGLRNNVGAVLRSSPWPFDPTSSSDVPPAQLRSAASGILSTYPLLPIDRHARGSPARCPRAPKRTPQHHPLEVSALPRPCCFWPRGGDARVVAAAASFPPHCLRLCILSVAGVREGGVNTGGCRAG